MGERKIVTIQSYRDGTGKSNMTANIAICAQAVGKRVADVQSPGIHILFNFDQERIKLTSYDFLRGKCGIAEVAYDISEHGSPEAPGNCWLVPASLNVQAIAQLLDEGYDIDRLSNNFDALLDKFDLDYLFIDTHPGLNEESMLAATLSDVLIILIRPDQQDYYGTAVLTEIAAKLDANGRPSAAVEHRSARALDAQSSCERVRHRCRSHSPVLLVQTPACVSRWRWLRAKTSRRAVCARRAGALHGVRTSPRLSHTSTAGVPALHRTAVGGDTRRARHESPPGMMAAKRWPTSRSSPNGFQDVVIVGTPDELSQHDGRPMPSPAHARSFVGQLMLRQTAELVAAAGAVVANDAGLAHVARGRRRWHSHGHHAVRPDRRPMPRSPSGQCHGDTRGPAVRVLLGVFAASVMRRQDLVSCRAVGVEEEIRGSLNADAEMVEATQARGLLSLPACERSRSPEVA